MTRGTIAGGSELTVAAGAEVLRAGGNATDAAVAAVFAAFHVEPLLASAAGGGVAIAGSVDDGFDVLNFVPAMAGINADTLTDLDFHSVWIDFGVTSQEFHIGTGAAAVPGGIVGLYELHRRDGRLPLREVLDPAIRLCRGGFVANDACEEFITILEPIWRVSDEAAKLYVRPDGERARAGDRLFNIDFAETLERLAVEGTDPFVRGDIAEGMVNAFGPLAGGLLTRDDLRAYEPLVQRPIEASAFASTVLTPPPPSTGGSLIALGLSIASAARGRSPRPSFGTPEYLREIVDLQLLVTALRREHVEHGGFDAAAAHDLLDRVAEHVERLGEIAPDGQSPSAGTGNTTHVSVIDADGGAAAITVSNGEGCGYVVPGTGMHMNNFLGEEDINPNGFHQLAPGVRLASMMSPTIVIRDGRPVLALGSGGSNRLRSAIMQVTAHLLDGAMSLAAAVDAPRIHIEPDTFYAEAIDDDLTDAIRLVSDSFDTAELFPVRSLFFGGVHAVACAPDGRLSGYGDPRRCGASLTVED